MGATLGDGEVGFGVVGPLEGLVVDAVGDKDVGRDGLFVGAGVYMHKLLGPHSPVEHTDGDEHGHPAPFCAVVDGWALHAQIMPRPYADKSTHWLDKHCGFVPAGEHGCVLHSGHGPPQSTPVSPRLWHPS